MFTLVDWLARLDMHLGWSTLEDHRRIGSPVNIIHYSISVVHKMLVYVYLCCN